MSKYVNIRESLFNSERCSFLLIKIIFRGIKNRVFSYYGILYQKINPLGIRSIGSVTQVIYILQLRCTQLDKKYVND